MAKYLVATIGYYDKFNNPEIGGIAFQMLRPFVY
jgi:hypothetical protein